MTRRELEFAGWGAAATWLVVLAWHLMVAGGEYIRWARSLKRTWRTSLP